VTKPAGVSSGLQDDETRIGFRPRRRHEQIDRHVDASARLERYEAPQAVVDLVDVIHLVQHRQARNLRSSADEDLADLPLAMDLYQLKRSHPTHMF
jgi:hypothetical protein